LGTSALSGVSDEDYGAIARPTATSHLIRPWRCQRALCQPPAPALLPGNFCLIEPKDPELLSQQNHGMRLLH